MKLKIFITLFLFSITIYSQDSLKVKNFSHDIGFNTVLLIKQLISNNPTNTLPQLPYSLFYNLYYKDKIGFRVGLGLATLHTETAIEGQVNKRVSNNTSTNFRLGASYNIVKTKRLTCMGYLDVISSSTNLTTTNTSTVQNFPNPIENLKTESIDKTQGFGGEVGVGVKFHLLKHLSIYTEIPLVFQAKNTASQVTITDAGIVNKTKSSAYENSFQIILPTTVYLVLTF